MDDEGLAPNVKVKDVDVSPPSIVVLIDEGFAVFQNILEVEDIVSIFVAVSDDEGFEELPNGKPAIEFVDVASIFVAVLDDEGFEELPNEKPAVEFSDVKSNLKDNSFPSALNFISFC